MGMVMAQMLRRVGMVENAISQLTRPIEQMRRARTSAYRVREGISITGMESPAAAQTLGLLLKKLLVMMLLERLNESAHGLLLLRGVPLVETPLHVFRQVI